VTMSDQIIAALQQSPNGMTSRELAETLAQKDDDAFGYPKNPRHPPVPILPKTR